MIERALMLEKLVYVMQDWSGEGDVMVQVRTGIRDHDVALYSTGLKVHDLRGAVKGDLSRLAYP